MYIRVYLTMFLEGDKTIWYLRKTQWLDCRSHARGIGAGCGIFY